MQSPVDSKPKRALQRVSGFGLSKVLPEFRQADRFRDRENLTLRRELPMLGAAGVEGKYGGGARVDP